MNHNRTDSHYFGLRSWTFGDPYFTFDGSFSLSISTFSEKMNNIYRLEV